MTADQWYVLREEQGTVVSIVSEQRIMWNEGEMIGAVLFFSDESRFMLNMFLSGGNVMLE